MRKNTRIRERIDDMKPHTWTLWLVVALLGTVGAGLVSRGWAEETHEVEPKDTGEVKKNFDIDKDDEEEVAPESVDTLPGGKIKITTKTFKHPTGWKFKKFTSDSTPTAPYDRRPFNPGQYVDIEIDPQCLPPNVSAPTVTVPQDGVDAIKVVVTDLTVPPTAGNFPLKCEGNLEPPPSGGGGGGGGAKKEWHWSARISLIDLDTDTNNNGTIDDYEDEYEEYPSGRVVCLDRKGDGESLDDLGLIVLTPPDTDKGTVKLEAIEGGSLIKVWRDENKSVEVKLPATWSPAETPGQLYVDGIALGQVVLKLSYTPPEGDAVGDSVALYVTETISWAPAGNYVTSWAPLYGWGLPAAPLTMLHDLVKDHGWDVDTKFFRDETRGGSCGSCTLYNFKNMMKTGGIAALYTHGVEGATSRVVCFDTQAEADQWRGSEPHMSTLYYVDDDLWVVRVAASWYDAWFGELTSRNAIVHLMSCYSSAGGADSVAAYVGGRVILAYPDLVNASWLDDNNHLFFECLNGYMEDGTRRTAGKAYGDGSQYQGGMQMIGVTGKEWTTLNPAPNAVFPQESVGGRKGAGCIIFDTYMDESQLPNVAVQKTAGGPVVSDRRWFANGSGHYLVSFDFESHAAGSITMKGEADCCKNKNPSTYGSTRKLSGDRQTYGEDKAWSF
jgi:hypothetical protein